MSATTLHIPEFRLEELPISCTMIVIGPPGSGKSSFIEQVCYYNKHKYPVIRVFSGTEASNQFYGKFIHPLYISSYYDKDEETTHIRRQQAVKATNVKALGKEEGTVYPGNFAINIVDDCTDDKRVLRSQIFSRLFKMGSQHFCQLFILGSHYAFELDPGVRNAVSCVAIFKQPEEEMRKKIYKTFGGICGSFENFNALMNKFTGDFTCLIIYKRGQSEAIEDCVYWYKLKDFREKKWRAGSKEYNKWAEERYNKSYVDTGDPDGVIIE